MNIIKKAIKRILFGKSQLQKLKEKGFICGENFNMYSSYIDGNYPYLISVGNNVTLSHCSILAHDASTKIYLGKSKIGKVVIGNNVFAGYESVILPNVTIGNDVIIGARSVVTKDIPNNSIVAGNPAKVIGKTSEYIEKHSKLIKKQPNFSKDSKCISMIKDSLNNNFSYGD